MPLDRRMIRAVVPAAGGGTRMGSTVPKQYLPLAGRMLAEHTLEALLAVDAIDEIVVALAPQDTRWTQLPSALRARVRCVHGGSSRADSVLGALDGFSRQPAPDDWILVHDMARPCVRPAEIARLIDTLREDEVGGLLAVPVVDTLKRADPAQRSLETIDRRVLWRAQTPQMFRYAVLRRALQEARSAGVESTDEAMAIERQGLRPRLVEGSERNIKVTVQADLALAAFFLGEDA